VYGRRAFGGHDADNASPGLLSSRRRARRLVIERIGGRQCKHQGLVSILDRPTNRSSSILTG
jgi:hypothetical protein